LADQPLRPYAGYNVLDKWDTPSFDATTRAVVAERLYRPPERRFFTAEEFALLSAACDRLIPQPDRDPPIPIAPVIDQEVFENRGEGFRAPNQPLLQDTWRILVAGLDAMAQAAHQRPFIDLNGENQDALLTAMQGGQVDAAHFAGLPSKTLFVEVLLKTAASIYYSHPLAWNEIGYGGPAAPRGYVRMGLDERDPWEAKLAPAPGDGL
jgi:hypothetical protein